MNDDEMVWFPDPIQCPECGLHTHELSRTKMQSLPNGWTTVKCDACYEDDRITELNDRGIV